MFTIQSVSNPKWDNAEHTSFSCDVKYAEFNEVHPTGVSPHDQYAHIQELWAKGLSGDYGPIAEWVDDTPSIPVVDVSPAQP